MLDVTFPISLYPSVNPEGGGKVYRWLTAKDFTLKTNPLTKEDLQGFIDCYNPENRNKRKVTWSEQNPEGR